MRTSAIACLFVLCTGLLSACGGGSTGAICNKMAKCAGQSNSLQITACKQQLNVLADGMRKVAWDAFADCLLGLECEALLGNGWNTCLLEAIEAVPEGTGDGFLEAYCAKMVECNQAGGMTVEQCVEQAKNQVGGVADQVGIFKDKYVDCMEDCVGQLACEEVYDFFLTCAVECDIPGYYEPEPTCENGWEVDGVCECDEGWAGEWCDRCADGYVSDGWDCVPQCQPDTCSGHGTCEDEYGHLRCTCDPGYDGDFCERCAYDYIEVDGLCRPTGGCVNDGDACDDGFVCTQDDTCSGGVCVGADVSCDDGLACTTDSCAEAMGGCVNEPVPTGGPEAYQGDPECDNGLDDDCDGLTDGDDPDCLTAPCGADADCPDDGNPCTAAVCDAGMCVTGPVPDATPCPGSDACTDTYLCRHDQCQPGPATTDSDGDGFVDGACPDGFDCDDADPAVHPGAEGPRGDATCADGLDNDCDGLVDAYDSSCWEVECTPSGWCRQNATLTGLVLTDVWANGPADAWAVGSDGIIMRWDGTGWFRFASPVQRNLNGVCGCAGDRAWAVGADGVLTWDGLSWELDAGTPGDDPLSDIWCQCGDPVHLYAVGPDGIIYHHDGTGWAIEVSGVVEDLNRVWAANPDEAWAVGRRGTMIHRQAGTWQPVALSTDHELNGVWGTAADRVWAVGTFGTVLAWDGLSWTEEPSEGGSIFMDLWGWPATDAYWIVGNWAVLQRQADQWNRIDLPGGMPQLTALDGTGPDDIWAVGEAGNVMHHDGTGWRDSFPTVEWLEDMCAQPGPDGRLEAYVVGRWRGAVLRWDGAAWQGVDSGSQERFSAVWCAGEHGVWALSEDGPLVRFAGPYREETTVGELSPGTYLHGLEGRYTDQGLELWAVGDDGLVAHFDGQAWSQEAIVDGWTALEDVYVSPDGSQPQVVVVGEDGHVHTFDGATWTQLDLGTTEDLNAVWGDGQGTIWIAGDRGAVFTWDGAAFVQRQDLPNASADFWDVRGTGPDDVWLIGWDGVSIWDGAAWSVEALDPPYDAKLFVTPDDAWLVGGYGTVLHRAR